MAGNFYEIDELLNEAVMTGVPILIVEGIDDISIYSDVSQKVTFDVEVYAVETIEGYGEGCDQVIAAVEELNTLQNDSHNLSNHILGVIDKDVRDFRGEIPDIDPILVLNYYSIESHFVSKTIVEYILHLCTKVDKELITDGICQIIMDEIETKLLDLYYFSLESLKNSLEVDYDAKFSYSFSCGRINDQHTRELVLSKRAILDDFATENNLRPCLDTLKAITKGKWLIDVFSTELIGSINNLKKKCEEQVISSCRSCITEAYDKCLYRIKDGFTKKTIKSLALSNVNGSEFNYIIERITNMKQSA